MTVSNVYHFVRFDGTQCDIARDGTTLHLAYPAALAVAPAQ
jgi:hypothetical protein